jgi:hypothetical protein
VAGSNLEMMEAGGFGFIDALEATSMHIAS